MFSIKLAHLPLCAAIALSGCATSMRMSSLPAPGDTSRVGNVQVRVVDLAVGKTSSLTPSPVRIPDELLSTPSAPYKVGPYDVLIVTVWEHPELTQPLGQYRNDLASGQLVNEDGTMFFPYAGRIQVAGKTVSEIQKIVTESLTKILRDPQVDIKVAAYRSQRIFVSGEVRNPGIQTIDDVPMSLPEVINRSGGILPTGDGSSIRLVRGGKVYELDLEGLVRSGAPIDKIRLQSGDQVRVPASDERVAYVLGEVARPTILRLVNGRMSLVRGLTEVGGYIDLTVNAGGVYVVRAEDTLHTTVYRLDGRSPVALAWAGQFQIQPKDLIYVDQSGLSRWNKVFQLLVPMSNVLYNGAQSALDIQTFKTNIR